MAISMLLIYLGFFLYYVAGFCCLLVFLLRVYGSPPADEFADWLLFLIVLIFGGFIGLPCFIIWYLLLVPILFVGRKIRSINFKSKKTIRFKESIRIQENEIEELKQKVKNLETQKFQYRENGERMKRERDALEEKFIEQQRQNEVLQERILQLNTFKRTDILDMK